MFFKGSRYEKVPETQFTEPGGRIIRYKRIRFIPFTPASLGHTVLQGQRLDHIAFTYYRDPERFWRICDANLAMWPDDLVGQNGRVILIPPSADR
jgi:hypothetical protein